MAQGFGLDAKEDRRGFGSGERHGGVGRAEAAKAGAASTDLGRASFVVRRSGRVDSAGRRAAPTVEICRGQIRDASR